MTTQVFGKGGKILNLITIPLSYKAMVLISIRLLKDFPFRVTETENV